MQKFSSFGRKKKHTKIRHRMVMLEGLQLYYANTKKYTWEKFQCALCMMEPAFIQEKLITQSLRLTLILNFEFITQRADNSKELNEN